MRFLKHWPPETGHLLRGSKLIDRDFQLRYTLLILASAMGGMILTLIPVYFFLNQNYQIFTELSLRDAPGILTSLEREQSWMNTLLVATLIGMTVYFTILGLKITNRLVGPLRVMKNHLHQLCRGNFHQKPITVRDTDEFQDLIETYNYFYNSFRQNLRRDLELLGRLSIDPKNRDAYLAWTALIEEKTRQFYLVHEVASTDLKPLSSASDGQSPDSRHAS